MQRVLVVDQNRQPLMPCHPSRARQLLKHKKATILRYYPFTIRLTNRDCGEKQPISLKVDPGSKTTGITLVADFQRGKRVVWAAELTHRGQQISDNLLSRRQLRHFRRSRKTRYRPARFSNRCHPKGWLPPSLRSRVENIVTWVNRLCKWSPVNAASLELVKFDTQLLQNPEITGVEYKQGELVGYEVREYLLEKWGRKCIYCGVTNVPLEIEHIVPKSRGGSNRVSNLTLACNPCNTRKGNQTANEFGFPDLQHKATQPLRDIAALNATRWVLHEIFVTSEFQLEIGTGAHTKYNRINQGYSKVHWVDAACVGKSGEKVFIAPKHTPLLIKATGRQSRIMCRPDKYGFPRTSAKKGRIQFGFQTGDMVRAVVRSGKKIGTHTGRVAVRSSGRFDITTYEGTVQGIGYRFCAILHRADGYTYKQGYSSCSQSVCLASA